MMLSQPAIRKRDIKSDVEEEAEVEDLIQLKATLAEWI